MNKIKGISNYNFDENNNLYLHALSYTERNNLCRLLDQHDIWIKLAVAMQFNNSTIQTIRNESAHGKSPSNQLITYWSEYNHTVVELFFLLEKLKLYKAMELIKSSVDHRYHRYILNSSICSRKSTSNKKSTSRETAKYMECDILKIDYSELVNATTNFKEENKIGNGSYGTVYKGVWKMTEVAIKKLDIRGDFTNQKLRSNLNELKYLNVARHNNILPLYGFSLESGRSLCLVCQMMQGGSLELRLSKKSLLPVLTWNERFDIAGGVALGLQFLHTFKLKPLIHGDIKPANILLDQNCQPKIADFGLTREGPILKTRQQISRVCGTRPYLPEEFIIDRQLSSKVDTFSYGVVLFELITGLPAYDDTRNIQYKFLSNYILLLLNTKGVNEIKDSSCLPSKNGQQIAAYLLGIGLKCTLHDPNDRPEMKTVYEELDLRKF